MNKVFQPIVRALLFCPLIFFGGSWAADINLYGYHLKPPYIIDPSNGTGLYYDLAKKLNQVQTSHKYFFEYLPRKRLESMLEKNTLDGLIVGVNPLWFGDKNKTKYGWSEPLLRDVDDIVSLAKNPVHFTGADSLIGKRIGLSLGYYYYGIDELVAKGQITRDDAYDETHSLDKLLLGRVDAIVISTRTLDYLLRKKPADRSLIFVSEQPHDKFTRYVLLPDAKKKFLPDLNKAMALIAKDPDWAKQVQPIDYSAKELDDDMGKVRKTVH